VTAGWAKEGQARRAAGARRRGTHAFGRICGLVLKSHLCRTLAGSVSAWQAVRHLPAAASRSLPARAAAAHEAEAGGSASSGGDTYAAVVTMVHNV
jgi:hypothetical protein